MVTKRVKIILQSEFKDYGSQVVLTVNLKQSVLDILILNLVLLEASMISSLELSLGKVTIFFNLSKSDQLKCSAFNQNQGIVKLDFNKNMLGYCMAYLLKYYRDGIAEAQHIDLDFPMENKEFTLTLVSERAVIHLGEDMFLPD